MSLFYLYFNPTTVLQNHSWKLQYCNDHSNATIMWHRIATGSSDLSLFIFFIKQNLGFNAQQHQDPCFFFIFHFLFFLPFSSPTPEDPL